LDYIVGLVLIVSPWVFDFRDAGIGTWLPVVLGVSALVYSALTDYELGLVRAIPMPAHLGLDFASGVLLAVSPWLFGFSGLVWVPHVVIGLFEIGAAAMTDPRKSDVGLTTSRSAAA